MDGSYMTKGERVMAHCVNEYKCLATGIVIGSQCAHRLHIKKCQMCAASPIPRAELFGKQYTKKQVARGAETAQRNIHIDGQWR